MCLIPDLPCVFLCLRRPFLSLHNGLILCILLCGFSITEQRGRALCPSVDRDTSVHTRYAATREGRVRRPNPSPKDQRLAGPSVCVLYITHLTFLLAGVALTPLPTTQAGQPPGSSDTRRPQRPPASFWACTPFPHTLTSALALFPALRPSLRSWWSPSALSGTSASGEFPLSSSSDKAVFSRHSFCSRMRQDSGIFLALAFTKCFLGVAPGLTEKGTSWGRRVCSPRGSKLPVIGSMQAYSTKYLGRDSSVK